MKKTVVASFIIFSLIMTLSIALYIYNNPKSDRSVQIEKPAKITSAKPIVHKKKSAAKSTPVKQIDEKKLVEPESYKSKYGDLPGLLQGTDPDGGFYSDSDGKLIVTQSIKERFDYYLSAVSVEGMENCIGRIEENIENSLEPEAAAEALSVLNSYINYKKSISDLHKNIPSLPAKGIDEITKIRTIMNSRLEKRREFFNEEVVEAFYGDQEIYDSFSLRKLEIHYDTTLTPEQKDEKYANLEKEMPSDMRESAIRERKLRNKYLKRKTE